MKARLQWAREHQDWSINQWKNVMWSDETKINLFGSDGVVHVWREKNAALKKECIRPTVKHGGGNKF